MKNMIKMEIGQRKGDVILLQQRERNKGTQTGDMALNESDVVLCVQQVFPFSLLNVNMRCGSLIGSSF